MKTEQQKVKEKIDKFLNTYADRKIYGWQAPVSTEPSAKKESFLELTRMPLWCPACKKIMNKRLDTKMYYLHGKCFNCTVEMETQMRIAGTWEEYERRKIKENVRSFIKDTELHVKSEKDRLDNGTTIVNVINEEIGSIDYEKWKLSSSEIQTYKERMDNILAEMHKDFEVTFGEKVYAQQDSDEVGVNATGE